MKRLLLILLINFVFLNFARSQNAWINEIHYDNVGTDQGEFVEIVIENAGSYTLADFQVDLYNGSKGTSYASKTVDKFTAGNTEGNYTFYYWDKSGIQNGAPDGLSLSYNGTLISGQFLSYEGSFTATAGPAINVTSTDIGVSESNSTTPVGYSLQLSGTGTQYSDFTWPAPATATKGGLNNGQTFGSTGPDNPTTFTATTVSTSEIDLSWTQNASNDNVMVAWSSDGTFGTPSAGTTYAAGAAITSGGTVLYNGSPTTYNHTSLTSGTHYYYKAWSVDGSNNYSGGVTADATTIPDLVITEVMQNPHDVSDANGEWFEIYNYGSTTVDINGYVIKDAGSDSTTINNGGALNIDAGSFLVLGKNSDVNTNGGVPVDYKYSGITLGNGADKIILCMSDGTTEVDRIEWDGGTNWPDPNGASMVFTGQHADDNNVGSNWTTATVRENNYTNPVGTETDKGSPGTNGQGQDIVSSTTWTGTGNWGEGNKVGHNSWNHGSPGSKVSVIIDGDVTIDKSASNPAVCKGLTINSGKKLTIATGKALTVNGNFTNNATADDMVIQSDATGNGSLIVTGSISGDVTVQRYVGKYTSGTGTGNGWHEIGCPVASMNPSGTNWDPNSTSNDLYAWSESDNQWVNYRTTPFTFSAGKGYLVANNTDLTHEFTGALNTGDVTVSGLTYTSGKGNGWHLLGNPFSSAIRWNDGNWTLTNVGTTAEIYDEESGNYFALRYNTTDYRDTIPSTDGFFVQVASGTTGSVTIPSVSRFHCGAKNNYKSEKKEERKETLIFEVTNDANSYYDVNVVGFKPEATEGWDIAFDAHKLFGNAKAPQLWTESKDQKFQVSYLPEVTTAYNVPLDFRAGVNTVYHLIIKGTDSFENTSLILKDLQTGQKIDLSKENSYDFSASKDDDPNRFVLHINDVTAVPTLNKTDGIQIFAYGKTVCLHASEQKSLKGKVSVFNMLGQVIYSGTLNGTNRQQFRLDQQTGIYFVRLEENNNMVTRKVFIK